MLITYIFRNEGPESVTDVENLKVLTNLTNTGDENLKILNDPRGPLSKMRTHTFAITGSSGSSPKFTGIFVSVESFRTFTTPYLYLQQVKYVPTKVVAENRDDAFTVLAPGESTQVEHDCKFFS